MNGSVFKRCPCKPDELPTGADGRRLACKKRHGTWSWRLDAGDDPVTGKRRRPTGSGYKTREEAEAALSEERERVNRGTWTDDKRVTVGQWLDRWIARREGALKPSTITAYRSHVEGHLKPGLGARRLRDLRPEHIYAALEKVKDGHSAATVQRVRATLRAALSAAVRERLLSWNPASGLQLAQAQKHEANPWEPRETGAFLDMLTEVGDRLAGVFHLCAYLGLRRGEALGIRWEDVDLDRRTITIRHTILSATGQTTPCPRCGGVHRALTFGTPKTAGSAGVVYLDAGTVDVLKAQRQTQDVEREQWGDAYLDHGLVFAREDGTPYPPNWVTHRFEKLQAAVSVPVDPAKPDAEQRQMRQIRMHDLRHGAASMMMAAGIDIAVVSKVLRHSTIKLTSDTYGHLLPGVGESTADVRAAMIPRGQSRAVGHSSATDQAETGSGERSGGPSNSQTSAE